MSEMKEVENRVMRKLLKSIGFDDNMEFEFDVKASNEVVYKAYEEYSAMSGNDRVYVSSKVFFESGGEEIPDGWDWEDPMLLSEFILMADESSFERKIK